MDQDGLEAVAIDSGGALRRALVGAGTARAGAAAIVMIHGAGATASIAAMQTGWGPHARTMGAIVAYPEGTPKDPARPAEFRRNPQTWNDGSGRGHVARAQVDDVAFLGALIDRLVTGFDADPAAIFLAGFSNGASLAFRAAAEMPGRIRGLAAVAGHCWVEPRGPVPPLLYLMGDADPLNPMAGGEVATPWGRTEIHPPPRRSFDRWARAAGCGGDAVTRDDGPVAWLEGAGCGVPVRMGIVAGQGHVWPGGPRLLPERIVGRAVRGIDATALIGDFFSSLRIAPA
ncbi:MAG TPA: PHB depolymerase family esterase [Gemmatimonadales bacterium]